MNPLSSPRQSTVRFITLAILLCLPVLASAKVEAQTGSLPIPAVPDSTTPRNDDKPRIGSAEEEMRVKQGLKQLEKEYKENVERAKEAAELSCQLRDYLKSGRPFGHQETKKLERLEKLAKKIRDDAGGSDEASLVDNPPGKLDSAVSRLADVAESLYKTVEKTPRQVISASIIENANVLLKLARLTRNLL